MAEITAHMWKNGNSYAVRIPTALIKCKVLDPTKPVRIVLMQDDVAEPLPLGRATANAAAGLYAKSGPSRTRTGDLLGVNETSAITLTPYGDIRLSGIAGR